MRPIQEFKISDIKKHFPKKKQGSVLLCSSSFDKRCLEIPGQFSSKDIAHVIIAKYQSNEVYVKENLKKLESFFSERDLMPLSIDDPIFSADSIEGHLSSIINQDEPCNILFDVTCFTRETLLMVLAYLQTCDLKKHKLFFVYLHAKKYETPLSKGIKEVRSVLGFSGVMHPARKTHLIILAGYEDRRAISIIQDFEPHCVSIGIGSKKQPPSHYPKAKETFESLINGIPNANRFEFDVFDPIATADAIEKEMNRCPSLNTIVAPMNTKVSTVGAALFALKHPAAQICYASAESYCIDGITPGDDCTFFEVPQMFSSSSKAIKPRKMDDKS